MLGIILILELLLHVLAVMAAQQGAITPPEHWPGAGDCACFVGSHLTSNFSGSSPMTKKRLLDDIRQNPARIYRTPGDVQRDRWFDDSERLQILQAWREKADGAASELTAMIAELENRLHISGHAAE